MKTRSRHGHHITNPTPPPRITRIHHDASSTYEAREVLRATGVVIALAAVLALIAIAFALPAAKSKPHDVPIGAVGAPAASGQVADMLEHSAPGAFALTIYPNEAALRDAIRDRNVYGGVVVEPEGRKLLTATGASPTIAQLLTQFGNGMAQQTGVPLQTEDLAPPPAGDPRGTGLAAAALPVTLAGFLPVVALTLVVRRDARIRIAATAAFSGLAGVTIAAVMRYALGSIDQNFWAVAGGLTLGALAAGLVVLGLAELFGRIGLVSGALLALLVGNPLSGLNSAPELLPSGWGQAWSVPAPGRQRDAAALDGVLRRGRREYRDRGAYLLGGGRLADHRHRPTASRRSSRPWP